MKHYIITGGTGLVGRSLSRMLQKQQEDVCFLSRRTGFDGDVYQYKWNIEKQESDLKWLKETDTIIHLAGAGVTARKWTSGYKKELYDSRIQSTRLLYQVLKDNPHKVKTLVAASAIGIYGDQPGKIVTEEDPAAGTFMAKICADWEAEVSKIASLGIRVVIIRVGIVLSPWGGMVPELAKPVRYYAGAALGSGRQMVSWIHIRDLCRIFIKAATDESMQGVYNAAAPHPVTNKEITQKIAAVLRKPLWLPNVPVFALKWMLGGMAEMLTSGQQVSCKKITSTGFEFSFPGIDQALEDVLKQ